MVSYVQETLTDNVGKFLTLLRIRNLRIYVCSQLVMGDRFLCMCCSYYVVLEVIYAFEYTDYFTVHNSCMKNRADAASLLSIKQKITRQLAMYSHKKIGSKVQIQNTIYHKCKVNQEIAIHSYFIFHFNVFCILQYDTCKHWLHRYTIQHPSCSKTTCMQRSFQQDVLERGSSYLQVHQLINTKLCVIKIAHVSTILRILSFHQPQPNPTLQTSRTWCQYQCDKSTNQYF